MRLDALSTTDTEGSPHPSSSARELALIWVTPSGQPPLRLDFRDAEERVIGRDPECAVQIASSDVSRRHAALRRGDSGFVLLDLLSHNGTRVNGAAIRTHVLTPGDVVRIGSHIAVVSTTVEPFSEIVPGLFGGGVLKAALLPVQRAAASNLPVVIEGETGTGKELVARAIHAWSGRAGAFVAVNCAALPESLAEAELFGYRRGAFTGAERASEGLLRSANRGSLLLDEIADLSLPLQAKLLRALEQREVQPLGETRPVPIDIRVIAAGQSDLLDAVRERRFRADLLARLDGVNVRLPPLRERREDVPELFATLWSLEVGARPRCELELIERLCSHDWPLNVRELVLLTRRLRVLHEDEQSLGVRHLPPRMQEPASASVGFSVGLTTPSRPELERPVARREGPDIQDLVVALRESEGNVARAAALVGISRQRAYRLLDEHTIDLESFRK